jgi:hypothetical protein
MIAHQPPDWVLRRIGRWYWRLVRRRPWVFALTALAGLAVGAVLIMIAPQQKRAPAWVMWTIGGSCVAFYAGLLVMFCIKQRRGQWVEFCSTQVVVTEEVFEERT